MRSALLLTGVLAAVLITLLAVACGGKTVPLENATFADNAILSGNSTRILGIHDTRQSQEYTRGAGCMQMMLGCWGMDIKEADIMELMDTYLK